jgi:hypothetical protein
MSQTTSPTLARDLPRNCQFISTGLTDLERKALVNDWREKCLEAEQSLLLERKKKMPTNTLPETVVRKISFEDETGLSPRSVDALRTTTVVATGSKETKKKSAWSFMKKVIVGKSQSHLI